VAAVSLIRILVRADQLACGKQAAGGLYVLAA
jgi:hypothetical protein